MTASANFTVSGASAELPSHGRIVSYILLHFNAFIASAKRLFNTPLANFFTLSVIGISLALPMAMLVLLQNLQSITHHWDSHARISLYLKANSDETSVQKILADLQTQPSIISANYISPSQSLSEFQKSSGFGDVLTQLATNPLPGVIEIEPQAELLHTPEKLAALVLRLKQLPQVDMADVDTAWVQRLAALLALGQALVLGIGTILALAVLLIVGNTIRLTIQSHHQEIEIVKLIGATDRFIRLPFLYTGIFFGLIGGVVAAVSVSLLLWLLKSPAQHLAMVYNSSFQLSLLAPHDVGLLLIASALLGLTGAWLAVWHQLKKIEPR